MSGIVSIILHSLAAFLRRKLKDLHNQGPQNRIFSGFWKYLLWCPMIMKTRTMCHHSSFIALLPNPFYTLLMNKSINALRNIMLHFHTSLVAFLLQTSLVVFECNLCYRYIHITTTATTTVTTTKAEATS